MLWTIITLSTGAKAIILLDYLIPYSTHLHKQFWGHLKNYSLNWENFIWRHQIPKGIEKIPKNMNFKILNVKTTIHLYVCVCVFEFYVLPTAKVIWRQDLGLKTHPKVWRSPGSNPRPSTYTYSDIFEYWVLPTTCKQGVN